MKNRWSIAMGLAGALALASLAGAAPDPRGGNEPGPPPPRMGGGGPEHGRPRDGLGEGREFRMRGLEHRREMMQELHLTSQQREKIATIRERQARKAIEQRAQVQVAMLDLRKLIRSERPDRAAIERQIDEVARLKAELRKSQVETLLDVRALLTPEQQTKFRERRMGMDG
jgi:Spy/CpxP family protein refolding chaperone